MALSFELGFRVDDKELVNSLSKIQTDIQNAFNIKGGLSTEIKAATQQAMILEQAMKKATTDKGISYYGLQAELRKAGSSAAILTTTLASGGDAFKDSLNAANTALALSNRSVISLNSKIQEMARVFKQSFKFTAAQTAIREITSNLQQAVSWVKNLNEAVNQIGVVTGKSADQLDKVTASAIKGAKELKIAAREYAEGALIFYQQGLDDEEVIRRNEITIKAAKAAGSSVEEMSSQLTAVWNTYGMIGDEQARAASVGARMAADTASDFSDIAEAMQISAAAASQMGVSYNSLAAMIATTRDVTQQSASVIGNAYKTIFSRFEQLKVDGTDGEVTLNRVSAQLEAIGVRVLDSAGELRELDDVILELGQNWGNYSQKQQIAIAELVGGTRQYGQFLALMQNFDKYLKEMQAAASETGSAETLEQQYNQAMQSIEAKAERAAESWHRAFGNIVNEDQLKLLYDFSNEAAEFVDGLLEGIGGLPGILNLVGVVLAQKIVPKLAEGAQNAIALVQNLTPEGRVRGIEKDYIDQTQAVDKRIAELREKGTTDLTKDNQLELINLETQKQKLRVNKDVAIINDRINTQLQTASGQYKIELQYQKQQLENAQQLYQTSLDIVRANEQAISKQKRSIETVNSVNLNKMSSLRRESENLVARNARLSDISSGAVTNSGITREQATAEIQANLRRIRDLNLEIAQIEGQSLTTEQLKNGKLSSDGNLLDQNGKIIRKNLTLEQQQLKVSYDLANAYSKMQDYKVDPSSVDQYRAAVKNVAKEVAKMTANATIGPEAEEALKRLQDEFSDLVITGEDGVLRLNKESKDFYETLNTLPEERLDEVLQLFGTIASSTGYVNEDIQVLIGNILQSGETAEQQKAKIEALFKALQNGGSPQSDGKLAMQTAQQATQLVMSVQMATQAVSGFFNVLKDADSTGADKLGAVVSMFASIGPAALMAIGPITEIFKTIKTQAGTLQATLGIIGLLLAGLSIVVSVVKEVRQARVDAAKADIENAQKEIEKNKEIVESIKESTDAVKENYTAWQVAGGIGEKASEAYDSLTESLTELNAQLLKAGINQNELNEAMTNALATGDMTAYNNLAERARVSAYQENEAAYAQKNEAQARLANLESKTTRISTYSAREKEILEQSGFNVNETSGINGAPTSYHTSFKLEAASVEELREEYNRLIEARKKIAKEDSSSEALGALDEAISGIADDITAIEENTNEATAAMREFYTTIVAADAERFNFENADFGSTVGYLDSLREKVIAYGESLHMLPEEIDNLYRSIVASNGVLNSTQASYDQAMKLAEKKFAQDSNRLELAQKLLEAENAVEEASKPIGLWDNAAAKQKELKEATEGLKALEQQSDDVVEAADTIRKKWVDIFNKFSNSDRELLLKYNLEFVEDKEDIQQVLDNIKGLKLKVDFDFRSEDELNTIIGKDNSLQEGLSAAISDMQDKGEVTLDVAKDLIDAGLGEYLTTVNGKFMLTKGAANAFNTSLIEERRAIEDLLTAQTNLRGPTQQLTEDMAVFMATIDNEVLEGFGQDIQDVGIAFLNSEGNFNDFEKYFIDLQEVVASSMESIQTEIDGLNDENLKNLSTTLSSISINLADSMAKADTSVAAGQMTIGEYNKALRESGKVQLEVTELSQDAAEQRKNSKLGEINTDLALHREETVRNSTELGEYIAKLKQGNEVDKERAVQLEQDQAQLRELEENYNDLEESVKNFDKQLSDLEAFDAFNAAVEKNHEILAGAINEDDFTLTLEIKDLTGEQLNAFLENSSAAFTTFGKLSEEAKTRVIGALGEASTAFFNKNTEDLNFTTAQEAINAGVTLNQLGAFQKAINGEQQTSIKNTSQAIGTMMDALADLIDNFDASISVGMEGGVTLTPSWNNEKDAGFKLFKGRTLTVTPTSNLKFTVSGSEDTKDKLTAFTGKLREAAAYFNSNDTVGNGNYLDYFHRTPTVASGKDFNSGDDVNKGSNGGGGSSSSEPTPFEDPDYFKRYTDIKQKLESTSTAVSKYSSATDDAFGKAKLSNMEKVNALLAKQGRLYEELYQEALAYAKEDKAALLGALETDGFTITFNEDQTIANMEDLQRRWEDMINATDLNHNKLLDENEEALYEAAKERVEHEQEIVEKYSEAVDEMIQALQDAVDNIREYMDNKLESIKYKVELDIEPTERAIKELDATIELLGRAGVMSGRALNLIGDKVGESYEKYTAYVDGFKATTEVLDALKDENSQIYKDLASSFEGGESAFREYLNQNNGLPAEYMDQLKEYADGVHGQILEFNDELGDLYSTYAEMFENFISEFDSINTRLENNASRLSLFEQIYEASGDKSTQRKTAEAAIATAKRVNAEASLDTAISRRDTIESENNRRRSAFDAFVDEHGIDLNDRVNALGKLTEAEAAVFNNLEAQLMDSTEQLAEAEADVISKTGDVVAASVEEAEKKILEARAKFVEDITGGVFNDFELLSTYYDDLEEKRKFFLDEYDKTYSLDTFDYQISDYLKDADILDPERLAAWEEFQERINKLRAEGVELTQDDIDKLQAEFELQKLYDQYKEAQSAKTTMRLARDASGNYNYVYSSDSTAEDLADIEQKIRDKQKEIRDIGKSIIEGLSAEYLQAVGELDDYLAANGGVIDEHAAMLQDKLQRLAERIQKSCDDTGIKFETTSLGMIANDESMINYHATVTSSFESLERRERNASNEKERTIDNNCKKIGLDYSNLYTTVSTEVENIMGEDKKLAEDAESLRGRIDTAMDLAAQDVGSSTQTILGHLSSMITMYDQLTAAIERYQQAADNYTPIEQEETGLETVTAVTEEPESETISIKTETTVEKKKSSSTSTKTPAPTQTSTPTISAEEFNPRDSRATTNTSNYSVHSGKTVGTKSVKMAYATGGLADFTGPAWLDGSKTRPELVLNPEDTQNILAAVRMMRALVISQTSALSNIPAPRVSDYVPSTVTTELLTPVQQDVKIDATFPNVSVASEVEDALSDLINKTAQYAKKK